LPGGGNGPVALGDAQGMSPNRRLDVAHHFSWRGHRLVIIRF
jgi:hypothetical protein